MWNDNEITSDKNIAFNTFQKYVAAILAPPLQIFHASHFKNPGSRQNREIF